MSSTPETSKRKNDERSPVMKRERQEWRAMWLAEESGTNVDTFIRKMRAELRGEPEARPERKPHTMSINNFAKTPVSHPSKPPQKVTGSKSAAQSNTRFQDQVASNASAEVNSELADAGTRLSDGAETSVRCSPPTRNRRGSDSEDSDGSGGDEEDAVEMLNSFRPRKEKAAKGWPDLGAGNRLGGGIIVRNRNTRSD